MRVRKIMFLQLGLVLAGPMGTFGNRTNSALFNHMWEVIFASDTFS